MIQKSWELWAASRKFFCFFIILFLNHLYKCLSPSRCILEKREVNCRRFSMILLFPCLYNASEKCEHWAGEGKWMPQNCKSIALTPLKLCSRPSRAMLPSVWSYALRPPKLCFWRLGAMLSASVFIAPALVEHVSWGVKWLFLGSKSMLLRGKIISKQGRKNAFRM